LIVAIRIIPENLIPCDNSRKRIGFRSIPAITKVTGQRRAFIPFPVVYAQGEQVGVPGAVNVPEFILVLVDECGGAEFELCAYG
jgi:hypothetical protein